VGAPRSGGTEEARIPLPRRIRHSKVIDVASSGAAGRSAAGFRLQAFGMDTCTPNRTAMSSGVKLGKMGENLLPDGNRYAELVGSLL